MLALLYSSRACSYASQVWKFSCRGFLGASGLGGAGAADDDSGGLASCFAAVACWALSASTSSRKASRSATILSNLLCAFLLHLPACDPGSEPGALSDGSSPSPDILEDADSSLFDGLRPGSLPVWRHSAYASGSLGTSSGPLSSAGA